MTAIIVVADSRDVRIAVSRGSVRLPMNRFDDLSLSKVRVMIAFPLAALNTPDGTRREENQWLDRNVFLVFSLTSIPLLGR